MLVRKITLLGGAALVGVIACICAVMTFMLSKSATERTLFWVDAEVEAVTQAVDAYDQTAKLLVSRFFKVFADQFSETFTLDEAGGRLTQLGFPINGNHSSCDKFTEFTGGVAAVLMRKNDAFVTISSSIKSAKGERDISYSIDAKHPAYLSIKEGKSYVGREILNGKPHITEFEPVRDPQGTVVGALFVAFDLTDFDKSLETIVTSAKFFDMGGIYVVDERAGVNQALVTLPMSLRGRKLSDVLGAPSIAVVAKSFPQPGTELRDFAPVLVPDATDRIAVARLSTTTGNLVVAELSETESQRSQWLTLAPFLVMFALAACALCIGLYFAIKIWVARPLFSLTRSIGQVASGDLSEPLLVETDDEVGDMMSGLEKMRSGYVEILSEVRSSADFISNSTQEISAGNLDLSRRTEQTAATLLETSSSVTEIYETIRETADAAHEADALARTATEAAAGGGEAVAQVVSVMKKISAGSSRIGEITGVIEAIAIQTNLLALNAAVEAARAGDKGKGFGVVADEVRSLATRAADAAKEIGQLLQDSVKEVESGSSVAGVASERMTQIANSIASVKDILASIKDSTARQSIRMKTINDAVSNVEEMTQQNAALVE